MISLENVIETYRNKGKDYRSFEYLGLETDCSYKGYQHEWECRVGGIIDMRGRYSPYYFTIKRLTIKALAEALENMFRRNEVKKLFFDKIFEVAR
jgi:hypothetical protein